MPVGFESGAYADVSARVTFPVSRFPMPFSSAADGTSTDAEMRALEELRLGEALG